MPEPIEIPFYVNRNLDLFLSEHNCIRSDANKRALYTEIKRQLPDISDDKLNTLAIDDAVYTIQNAYSDALDYAFETCLDKGLLIDGLDDMPGRCFEDTVFMNPNSKWPISPRKLQKPESPEKQAKRRQQRQAELEAESIYADLRHMGIPFTSDGTPIGIG